ncbi:MAG: NAD(P)-binding domain-containing protein [Mollicutes bacterium PWAP]|nr:NAD(P)-binding domain-containing protein [Mollicutes bacterium PWAP]
MKIAIFDAKGYDKEFFDANNKTGHEIKYFEENLSMETVSMAKGFEAVSGFVNTPASASILEELSKLGVNAWLQRSMGYNRVDLAAANKCGIKVYRVDNYSAESVAEHALSLLMATNRRLIQANNRTTCADFSLNGLQGKAISGSTVGVIGSGKIGQMFIKAIKGMGANVIVFDEYCKENFPDTATKLGFEWASKKEDMLKVSDFISLHAPLLPSTKHIIDAEALSIMKDGVIIINAARGPLIDTKSLVKAIKSGKVAAAGLDVVEREEGRFFFNKNKEIEIIKSEDPEWKFLMEDDRVLVTAHQAFFTTIALNQIAQKTLSAADFHQKGDFSTSLKLQKNGKVING